MYLISDWVVEDDYTTASISYRYIIDQSIGNNSKQLVVEIHQLYRKNVLDGYIVYGRKVVKFTKNHKSKDWVSLGVFISISDAKKAADDFLKSRKIYKLITKELNCLL